MGERRAASSAEVLFATLAEHISEVFWLYDLEQARPIYVSPAYEKIWGRPAHEMIARVGVWSTTLHPEDRGAAERSFADIVRRGGGELRRYRIVRPDGDVRWIADRGFPVREPVGGVRYLAGIAEDVTDRQRLEAELARTHKIESIGVLAGGLAHDFNNLLTSILGNISLSKMQTDSAHPAHKTLDEAQHACRRAQDLTQQLLTLARGGAPVRAPTSMAELVRESAGFALRAAGVGSHVDIPPDLWCAQVDAPQVSQVLHNVVLNAVQAMPAGGSVHIEACNVPQDAPRPEALGTGSYVCVRVRDHGPGIDAELLPHIFEPYVTTKPGGRGLGLAIAHTVVRNHGGHIDVESASGCGTTFAIYLPATPDVAPPHCVAKTVLRGTQTGKRVLQAQS